MNITKQFFYYFRDGENKPRTTICLLKAENGALARGIAHCSLRDNPDKAEGRIKAFHRANAALINQGSTLPIKRVKINDFLFKSKFINNFNEITSYEKKLLGVGD